VQTYPQGRSIRACILSTIGEILSANASPLQKRDAPHRTCQNLSCYPILQKSDRPEISRNAIATISIKS
jgi:hypothetical protein